MVLRNPSRVVVAKVTSSVSRARWRPQTSTMSTFAVGWIARCRPQVQVLLACSALAAARRI